VRNKDAIVGLRDSPSLNDLVRYINCEPVLLVVPNPSQRRLAAFSDYAPDLHAFCKARLAELEQWDPQLQRPFKDTLLAP